MDILFLDLEMLEIVCLEQMNNKEKLFKDLVNG